MRTGFRHGWMMFLVFFLGRPGAGLAGETKMPLVRSPQAVVEAVRADGLAGRAGLKNGDQVVAINGQPAGRLEAVLAYRYDWEKGRDTVFLLRRGEEKVTARAPQGDWDCDFRPDLSAEALKRLEAAREALKKPEGWEEGLKAYEALVEEAWQAKPTDPAIWLTLDLVWSLLPNRHGPEAKAVLEKWAPNVPDKGFWGYLATQERGRACLACKDLDGALQNYARAGELAKREGQELRQALSLSLSALLEWGRGKIPESQKYDEQYLEIRQRLAPDSLLVASSLRSLGTAVAKQGDLPKAQGIFEKSLALTERLAPDSFELARISDEMALLLMDQGDLPKAKGFLLQSLAIKERLVPDTLDVANTYNNMGKLLYAEGDLATTKAYFLKSLAIKERLAPGSRLVAIAFNNLASVAADLGDLKGSRDYFEKALALQERFAPGSLAVADNLANLAVLDGMEGDFGAAREKILKSLAIRESKAPNSLAVSESLSNLAGVLSDMGDLAGAKEAHLKALAIRERLAQDSLDVAHTLSALSSVYLRQGDLAMAQKCATRALAIQERLAPKSLTVAKALIDLANVLESQGDLAAASEYLARALAVQEELAPNGLDLAVTLNGLGLVARKQGDLAMAREYTLKAMAVRERLAPNSIDTAYLLNNLGALANDRGDLAAAREFHTKALAIEERLAPDSLDVAQCLTDLGTVAWAQGDPAAAAERYRKALAIMEKLAPEGLDVAYALCAWGRLQRQQGDFAAARAGFGRALAIQQRLAPGSRPLADSQRELALTEKAAGALPQAAEYMAQAVDTLEAQRSRAGGEAAKTAFSAATGAFYTDLIAAYLDTQRPSAALEALERSRARTMLEMVSSRFIDLQGEVPEPLLVRQRELAGQRRALSDKLARAGAKTDAKQLEAWRAELLMLPQKEDALAEEIRKASPRLAALQYPQPLAYAAMRDALAPGALVVAYAVGETETYLFTLRKLPPGAKGPELQAVRLKMGRKEMENRVMAYRNIVGQPDTDMNEWRKASRELFALLLGPVVSELAACGQILLLPDGPLHLLPFTTLLPGPAAAREKTRLDPARPLGFQRPISVQASLTVYQGLRSGPAPGRTAQEQAWTGIGDPVYPESKQAGELRGELDRLKTRGFRLGPLPGTRQEIEGIANLFGEKAQVYLGPAASKEAVLTLLPNTRYVHFACHGLLDPDFPMNSALALSPSPGEATPAEGVRDDGLLQAWEIIQGLRLDSDCVVLSACETGVGKVYGGEGIMGLGRAFLYAGGRSVIMSLWPISDESTARFMQAFYREILAGAPRDAALQRAQAALARRSEFAHPFHWAAFLLMGAEK